MDVQTLVCHNEEEGCRHIYVSILALLAVHKETHDQHHESDISSAHGKYGG
jgi:hypothetical protein